MTPSDAALMQRIQDRDSAAFTLLFERYQARLADHVWGVVRDPAAAEDLVQEVFLRVWNRAHQWSGGSLQSWLFRIGTNLALNHLRGKKRRREQPLEMPVVDDEDESEHLVPRWLVAREDQVPDAAFEQEELRRMLWALIDALPEEKREVFQMVHDEELGLEEVAERLAIPRGTVKSRLFYARKHLSDAWRRGNQT